MRRAPDFDDKSPTFIRVPALAIAGCTVAAFIKPLISS
jgi:hypothetical protein